MPRDLARRPARHVVFDPSPKAIELRLLVELDGRHHAVRHALGPHVVVPGVEDIRLVRAWSVVIDGVRVRGAKELAPRGSDFGVAFRLRVSRDGDEKICVRSGRRAAFSWNRRRAGWSWTAAAAAARRVATDACLATSDAPGRIAADAAGRIAAAAGWIATDTAGRIAT